MRDLCLVLLRFIIENICSHRLVLQTWTEHEQHEVRAVASNQGAADGKSPQLQNSGILLSDHYRFEAPLTPSEGSEVHCRRRL